MNVAPRPGGQPTATLGPRVQQAAAGDPVQGVAVGPAVRGSVDQQTVPASPVQGAAGQQSSPAGPGVPGQRKRPFLSLEMVIRQIITLTN